VPKRQRLHATRCLTPPATCAWLKSAPAWVNVALIIMLALAVPLASLRFRPIASLGLAVGLGIAFTIGTQLAFNSGRISSYVYAMGTLVLSTGGSVAVQLVTEAFERIRTRDLFSRFVPEDVVDEVLASSGGLRLGGIQREGTVMFSDLRGFTSMAETLTPARVIEVGERTRWRRHVQQAARGALRQRGLGDQFRGEVVAEIGLFHARAGKRGRDCSQAGEKHRVFGGYIGKYGMLNYALKPLL
jgi:adenylate cyclase